MVLKVVAAVLILMINVSTVWSYIDNSTTSIRNRSGWIISPAEVNEAVNINLKQFGAEGYVDFVIKAPNVSSFTSVSQGDSLEVLTSFSLPRCAIVDSMWLWIDTLKQPAMHITRWQAEATYNQIVNITRRDPAILTLEPDNNTDESGYSLRVFPIFKNGSRKVRLHVRFAADPYMMSEEIPLGRIKPGTSFFMTVDKTVKEIPVLIGGRLSLAATSPVLRYSGSGFTNIKSCIRWGSSEEPVNDVGVSGRLDAVEGDTSYFSLKIDMKKFLKDRGQDSVKSCIFAWAVNHESNSFYNEKRAILECLDSMRYKYRLNVFTAEGSVAGYTNTEASLYYGGRLSEVNYTGMPAQDSAVYNMIKMAFRSIQKADSPAVVVLVDLAAPLTNTPRDSVSEARRGGELVLVNIYRSRLVAFVHPAKKAYYMLLGRMLSGSVYAGWLPTYQTITASGNKFIKDIRFLCDVSDVMIKANDYYNYCGYCYYGISAIPNNVFTISGKTLSPYLLGEIVYDINGVPSGKAFAVTRKVPAGNGTDLRKNWIKEASGVSVYLKADNTDFYRWGWYGNMLVNPSSDLWNTTNYYSTSLKAPSTLSRRYGVLTQASALIALEPGMSLIGDSTDGWWGGTTGGLTLKSDNAKIVNNAGNVLDVFPNPFNPVTKITFSVTKRMKIKLALYDLAGRRVMIIKDGL
ncbi:MAG: hypothetical protein JNL74_06145, partial [Fibrobacteres bacterium]|nr:hypothetical protein [Fibrobacterota bacterium]